VSTLALAVSGATARAGPVSWILEVAPGIVLVAVLAALYARLPLSHFVYRAKEAGSLRLTPPERPPASPR
jgi:hypothetical protein